ncbi:hypothetical protein MBLNU230_g3597t1 [Neophaeotheca triangularis]
MPGVPSSKACDGCRKQKKKCDESTPVCGRCKRLKLACVGSGERRYKFQIRTSGPKSTLLKVTSSASSSTATPDFVHACVLSYPPANSQSTFCARIISTVKFDLGTDLRYSLAWSSGNTLSEIPKRLGTNPALDAAMKGIVTCHEDLLTRPGELSQRGLRQYMHSLKVLSKTLDDPALATSPSTLAAIYVLMLTQPYNGVYADCYTGHAEGAAKIIKIKGFKYEPKDDFERNIMTCFRAPVLIEGLLNPNIRFSPSEWRELIVNPLEAMSAERKKVVGERMLYCLSRVPELTSKARKSLHDQRHDGALAEEANDIYNEAMECLDIVRASYLSYEAKVSGSGNTRPSPKPPATDKAARLDFIYYADSQRLYGLALFTVGYINKLIRSFGILNASHNLEAEAAAIVSEIIAHAEASRPLRPMGAAGVPLSLVIARINVRHDDYATIRLIEDLHTDYCNDFPGAKVESIWDFTKDAEWVANDKFGGTQAHQGLTGLVDEENDLWSQDDSWSKDCYGTMASDPFAML